VDEWEIRQYYVENAHEAIIEPAVFDVVQQEITRRANGANWYSGFGMFINRIKCAFMGPGLA